MRCWRFIVLLLTGLLVTNLIGRRLIVWGEEFLNHIPVVRTVYGGVKSFTESVFSQSNAFRKVVMIQYPRPGAWSIGFMTAEDVPEVSEKLGAPHAAVYLSVALNATAGYLVMVPRSEVVDLDMSVDAAMKMIITCGVVVPAPASHMSHPAARRPAPEPRGAWNFSRLRGAGAYVTSRASCVHITADKLTSSSSARKSRSPAGCIAVAITAGSYSSICAIGKDCCRSCSTPTPRSFQEAERLRSEFVVKVSGKVRARPAGTVNANLASGRIEVLAARDRGPEPLRAAAIPAR